MLPITTVQANGHSELEAAKPEPEKIRVWREEQEKMLKQKDQEEAIKKEELKQQAKLELADWDARYKEQLEKSKKNNRSVLSQSSFLS